MPTCSLNLHLRNRKDTTQSLQDIVYLEHGEQELSMARVVDESDDEFPEVEDLLRDARTVRGARKQEKVFRSNSTKSARSTTLTTKGIAVATGEKMEEMSCEGRNTEGTPRLKKKAKKRVLVQTSDNPLLRPLISSNVKSTSSDSTERVLKARARNSKTDDGVRLPGRPCVRQPQPGDSDEERARFPAPERMKSKSAANTKSTAISKSRSALTPEPYEDPFTFESDGLSDFIVNDSSFLDEQSLTDIQSPKPARKLKSRKKLYTAKSVEENMMLRMENLALDDHPLQYEKKHCLEDKVRDFVAGYEEDSSLLQGSGPAAVLCCDNPGGSQSTKERSKSKDSVEVEQGSDVEEPCTLRYSPSMNRPKTFSENTRLATPPGAPDFKNRKLLSPTKKFSRIPSTPHRPSMDGFWDQDIINEWNDEYSPRKTLKSRPGLNSNDNLPQGTLLFSPKKSPSKQDRMAKEAKKLFLEKRNALAESFLHELDTEITNGRIAELSSSTGGVKIIWSKKLNTTAGRANWKCETVKPLGTTSANATSPTYKHHAAIELAEKVIDDEDRLLNVIAHEFCHLANFMISKVKNNPHGKEFKVWAAKCSLKFGHRGIEVTTKHSYDIDYKYIWECENCGCEFKRHSKSIDPVKQRCGKCKSTLVQTKPEPRAGGQKPRAVNEYQMFVKENMSKVREENPGSPQKDIMALVGKQYQAYKAAKLVGEVKEVEEAGMEEFAPDEQFVPEDNGMATAVEKLDLLDLEKSI